MELGFVDILMLIVSITIIILVALQHQKQGLSDSLTNGDSELFKQQKERGAEAILSRLTHICCIAFLVLGFAIYIA